MANYDENRSPVNDFLSDVSPKDKPWDRHRAESDGVQAIYLNTDETRFRRLGQRVTACADVLKFLETVSDDGEIGLKLKTTHFCRVRHCPVCQWRRSLFWQARFYQSLPEILVHQNGGRWLFLTLTVRNCAITELRETIQQMNKSWQRLIQRKRLGLVRGWVRTTEVTRAKDGSAHPHFHCLLLVDEKMLRGRNYVPHAEWVQLWQKSMRLNYGPNVDIRAVRDRRGVASDQAFSRAISETLKYAVKPSDMTGDPAWFLELTRQVDRLRFIATGGVLKDVLKEDVSADDLLLHDDDEQEDGDEDNSTIDFRWAFDKKRYRRSS